MAHDQQPTDDGRFPRRDLFSTNPRPQRQTAKPWSERRVRHAGADIVRAAEELCIAAVKDPMLLHRSPAQAAAVTSHPRLRDRTLVVVAVLSWVAAIAAMIVGFYPLAAAAVPFHVAAIATLVLRDPVP